LVFFVLLSFSQDIPRDKAYASWRVRESGAFQAEVERKEGRKKVKARRQGDLELGTGLGVGKMNEHSDMTIIAWYRSSFYYIDDALSDTWRRGTERVDAGFLKALGGVDSIEANCIS